MDLFRSPDFSAYVKKLIERHHVPGLAIAIVQNGKVASAAYGKASLDPPRDFRTDTLFCVGSSAKSLTAASVAVLVEDNDKYPQVQFDATMSSLLPGDFVMPGKDHDDVTVEDVLCHRTGMAPHEYSILGPQSEHPDDPRSLTRNLRNLSVIAPNRAEHIYCNMMYTASTYMIERISGMSFYDFMYKNILEPLDMKSTYLLMDRVRAQGLESRVATGYCWDKGKHREMVTCDGPEAQGAGQIYSTIDDYIKWVKAMLQHEGPVTEKMAKSLTTKRIQQDPEQDPEQESCAFYALGWQVHQYSGYTIVSHDGGEPGFQCNHFFLPELNFGGVIFSNADEADTVVSLLMYRMIDEVAQKGGNGRVLREEGLGSESESGSDSESVTDDDEDDDGLEEELRQELSPGLEEPEPQKMPLSTYTGNYSHPGYHNLKVEVKDEALYIDATDRSYGFTLTFKHICEQTKYIGYMMQSFETTDLPIKAEFRLEGNKAVRLGLHLQERVDDYIWFDRVEA
ncbi:hypothetical protein CP533_3429 [Ophiocordyceps camponoti-saundersi (nom. inval.)]|nr:hypothetical protein CP533_3429 [Ophiocordyceps camponoti-saundersi (nom. inval.)]